MLVILDYKNRKVRLSEERLIHILAHPEMVAMEAQISNTLKQPQLVRRSRMDDCVDLLYRFYTHLMIGDKWLCVVVKYLPEDAFIVTAYFTDKPKKRRNLVAEQVKVWFDPEADFLEVLFTDAPGYMRETDNDAVMERVDAEGKLLGFAIMAVSQLAKATPISAELSLSQADVAINDRKEGKSQPLA